LVPFIIIGGILSGKFTATESGMVAAIYSLVLVALIYRSCNFKDLIQVFKNALVGSAQPLLCIGGAGAFGYMMAYLRVPQILMQAAGPIVGNPILTLLFITVLYIILGTFMDAIPAIVIFLPLVLEMAKAANINSVHMGVLVTVVLCFGLLTPPYGMTLLLSSGIAGISAVRVIRALKWFYIVYIIIILVLIFVPDIILFVPKILVPSSFAT